MANGVRLLNLALMTSEPLAQMVLAISSIGELGQSEKWNDKQRIDQEIGRNRRELAGLRCGGALGSRHCNQ